ncbi:hypothetical protein D3C72_2554580 [compost metagenome]
MTYLPKSSRELVEKVPRKRLRNAPKASKLITFAPSGSTAVGMSVPNALAVAISAVSVIN